MIGLFIKHLSVIEQKSFIATLGEERRQRAAKAKTNTRAKLTYNMDWSHHGAANKTIVDYFRIFFYFIVVPVWRGLCAGITQGRIAPSLKAHWSRS